MVQKEKKFKLLSPSVVQQKSKQSLRKVLSGSGYGGAQQTNMVAELSMLGGQVSREECCSTQHSDQSDKGKTIGGVGRAQRSSEGCVEEYLPTHSDKPRIGFPPIHRPSVELVAKSLVEFQDGSTNGEGRNTEFIEDLPRKFFDTGFVRIGQASGSRGEGDNGGASNCNQLGPEYGDNENGTSMLANQGGSNSRKLTSAGDGSVGTWRHACNSEKANMGQSERDGMEVNLTGENNVASR